MKELYVHALNFDQNAWRVDWFGDLDLPDRDSRWTQRSFRVMLSSQLGEMSPDLLGGRSVDSLRKKQIWVSVGQLALLRVGDIWRCGKLAARPDYALETFEDLVIGPETALIVKAGISPEKGQFLLPWSEHPWHREHTHAYCMQVTLADHRRILVPCWELIRFYFGSSSNLLAQLFQPDLRRDRLYTDRRFNQKTRRIHLNLAHGISGISASDIARLALDPVAWGAARSIGASCLKASLRNEPVYPYARFPFEGNTTLVAAGKWLSYAGQDNATFIVFNLRTCTHPFPFNSLRYESFSPKKKEMPVHDAGIEEKDPAKPVMAKIEEETGSATLRDEDPGKTKMPRNRAFEAESKFPDLNDKQIWRSAAVSEGASNSYVLVKDDGSLENIESTGSAVSIRKTRAIDLEATSSKGSPHELAKMPSFLKDAIRGYQKTATPGATVSLIFPSSSKSPVFNVPHIIDGNGEINPVSFFFRGDGSRRSRRAAIINVKSRFFELHIAFVEGTTSAALHHTLEISDHDPDAPLTDGDIDRYLSNAILETAKHDTAALSARQ